MTPFQLYSIGFACQQLQMPISNIITTAERLGIVPSAINGVSHFAEADVELIRAALLADAQRRESLCIDQRAQIM